jgi:malonyl-CoA O-methyltransferase
MKSFGQTDIPDVLEHAVIPTQAGYDRWAEFYDEEDNPLILLEESQLGPLFANVSGLAFLDLGCGTGRHALRLAAKGAKVTAVDFSRAMLDRARNKPGAEKVTFVYHDLTSSLPFPSASFDRLLACLMLEHVADLEPLFVEMRRLCKPDGTAIVSEMHPAMGLRGVQARFIDPATGGRISPRGYPHQIAEYVMAAIKAGWSINHISEHAVDAALAAHSPRGTKYLGWPMLLLLRLDNALHSPRTS